MSNDIEVKRINLCKIVEDMGQLRIHPDDTGKLLSIVSRLAGVAGAIEALTQLAGAVFAAHAAGNTMASDAFYEVLLSLETHPEGEKK